MKRAALAACALTAAVQAQAQLSPDPADLRLAISKQQAIYQSKGAERPEGYVIDRSLRAYSDILPADFARRLKTLRTGNRWLDVGAGEANAMLDYAAGSPPARRAEIVAMSIEDRRTERWHKLAAQPKARLQYVHGRPLREYSARELGRFDVITDIIGGFSYTTDMAVYMERALSVLNTGGSLYTVLQDVHMESTDNKPHYAGYPYTTELRNPDGSELRVCSWLRSIGCVQVSCENRPGYTPPIEVYHVRKVCDAVQVPAMTTLRFTEGTPPERAFRMKTIAGSTALRD